MKTNRSDSRMTGKIRAFCLMLLALAAVSATVIATKAQAALSEHHMKPYTSYYFNHYEGDPEKTFSMMSNKYTYGFTKTSWDNAVMYFNLDRKVSAVSFIVGHLDGGEKDAGDLKIYYDDVYQDAYYKKLTNDMSSQKVTLPTTGVRKLTICIENCHYGDYGIANMVQTSVHDYESKVTKVATALESGIRKYTCKECGYSYTETIPARTYCEPYMFPYDISYLTKVDETEGSSTFFTVMGNNYYQGLKRTSWDNSQALFNLNGEYNSVRFTVGHLDNAERDAGTLKYYVDGNELDSIPLSCGMTDRVITVDNLSSAMQLKIEIVNCHYGDYAVFNIVGSKKNTSPVAHSYEDEVTLEAQFGVKGIMTHKCKKCGAFYTSLIPALKRSLREEPVTVELSSTSFTYNGKAKKPTVTVKYGEETLIKGTDYSVSYKNAINAGKATVTVVGKGNYKHNVSVNYTIAKAKQSMTVKVRKDKFTASYSTLKGGTKSFKKTDVFTVKNAKGTVTFQKVSGSGALSIHKTTGKVTVARKTKKGSYSMKVKVTASGGKNYKQASKTVTVKVKVQ